MYLTPPFNSTDSAIAQQLMRAHPFASLISTDAQGLPFVTHLPLHLVCAEDGAEDGAGVAAPAAAKPLRLLGHVAKPNPHWRYLQQRPQAVVTFLGPQAYMSPQVYPDLARVPSWNYLAVHCTVTATLVEDPVAKDSLLKKLIGDHEPAYAAQWRALGDVFAQKMLAGIVGFELQVDSLQCKLKLNQHRPESHAAMHALYQDGNAGEQALAAWMERLGMLATPTAAQ